jgi:hypothetical protein
MPEVRIGSASQLRHRTISRLSAASTGDACVASAFSASSDARSASCATLVTSVCVTGELENRNDCLIFQIKKNAILPTIPADLSQKNADTFVITSN